MSEKPTALQLADEYACDGWIAGTRQWCEEAATELRRQHDEIEQLREQNTALDAACAKLEKQRDDLLEALEAHEDTNPPFKGRIDTWQQAAGIARRQRDELQDQRNCLILKLAAAANYIDTLGGDSRPYRQVISSI